MCPQEKNHQRKKSNSSVSAYSEGYFEISNTTTTSTNNKSYEGNEANGKCNTLLKQESYRMFRLLMTDVNTSGTHHLFCSGLEFYGTLYY